MRKEFYTIPLAFLVAFGIIGCSTVADGFKESVAPIPTVAAVSQDSASSSLDLVSVSGKAEVKVTPDKASISLGVEVKESSAEAANTSLDTKMASVVEALKSAGVEEKDIATDYYDVSPDYKWTNDEQVMTGYRGVSYVDVTGVDIDDVSAVISKAMSAGADSTGQIRYYSSNYKESYDEALNQAIAEAKAKADKMGEAAGFKVKRVHYMEEGYQDTSARYVTNSMKSASYNTVESEAGGGISAGELSIEARVTVEYVIE